jgi:hypothetical protein
LPSFKREDRRIVVAVLPFEAAIRVPGYQEVDIRISEYQAEKEVLVWSPDTRPNQVE